MQFVVKIVLCKVLLGDVYKLVPLSKEFKSETWCRKSKSQYGLHEMKLTFEEVLNNHDVKILKCFRSFTGQLFAAEGIDFIWCNYRSRGKNINCRHIVCAL